MNTVSFGPWGDADQAEADSRIIRKKADAFLTDPNLIGFLTMEHDKGQSWETSPLMQKFVQVRERLAEIGDEIGEIFGSYVPANNAPVIVSVFCDMVLAKKPQGEEKKGRVDMLRTLIQEGEFKNRLFNKALGRRVSEAIMQATMRDIRDISV
ncbi:MAG: hypothetical protein US89_C0012G0006 [Candidatus Peregrinibacteria bacterium GW2011_GWF2_38_29]|nr:MAG: hypothetical protein US89_C0012G0006 [Candidatus Peregrinibacteria bacterium GW2011_GWF2_38_29]HBB02490.1 hypothetical protein [Candidatus Peregrinibacteria bacterium]